MNKKYWLSQQRGALAMAESSSDLAGRNVHIELARRYGNEAGQAQGPRAPKLAEDRKSPCVFDL